MIEVWLFAVGIVFGLLVSLPVGPVNLMVINRTLHFGFGTGFAAGLGAVLADTLFAAIALFGLNAVAVLEAHLTSLQLVGGCVLIVFGLALIHHRAPPNPGEGPRGGPAAGVAAACVMSITNPGTFFGFLALFSTVQGAVLIDAAPVRHGFILLCAIALGAAAWWLAIAGSVAILRERMTERAVVRINTVSGAALIALGGLVLLRLGLSGIGLVTGV